MNFPIRKKCPGQFYLSLLSTRPFSEVKLLSRVQLFAIPWTVAYQAPPSMEFSRQEYWSGLPFPSPGDLPDPGIKPRSPTLQADALLSYDLNQIPYDYTVEVRNRFKGLDLIDRVPDELWMEVRDIVEETGIKTISKKKKCKKAKWLSKEALQIAVKRREVKSKVEKERYTHLNAEFQRIDMKGEI